MAITYTNLFNFKPLKICINELGFLARTYVYHLATLNLDRALHIGRLFIFCDAKRTFGENEKYICSWKKIFPFSH
jgi:hypothetical protein